MTGNQKGCSGAATQMIPAAFQKNLSSFPLKHPRGVRGIRFNAVAPGVVNTALHQENSQEHVSTPQPLRNVVEINDIFDAVLYLAHARQVTGEVLQLAGGGHVGQR